MTGSFGLDWATASVSLFNTILLLWLGFTILLNADKRGVGVWVMGGGLLSGGIFFISHTAILGHGISLLAKGLEFWWQIGWIPVIVSPFTWYGLTLWYGGFWSQPQGKLRRRHRLWFYLVSLIGITLFILVGFTHALPSFTQLAQLDLSTTLTINGLPVLLTIYPVFIVLCITLSVDALRHPAPSARIMGEQARERTRPWLMAASITLLVVSLLVAWFIIWAINSAQIRSSGRIMHSTAWFDLGIELLIAVSTLFTGQAVVSYEVFTGKTLPRRGFLRHWYNAVILAGGYSLLVGWSLAIQLRLIYSLLLTTLLMVAFYALFSWRSFAHRDQFMSQLRPFVHSQQLMEHLADDTPSRATVIFQALCRDVLNVKHAQLLPKGALAPLVGPTLSYPLEATYSNISLPGQIDPNTSFLFIDDHPQLRWAIPLWAERGLIGVLFLGEKFDEGLFSLEEIEIARATGERVVDMLASEEMARRLVGLQRRRMAETQVLDHRTRRVLHDEILPELHMLVLSLAGMRSEEARLQGALDTLSSLHQRISDLIYVHPGLLAHQGPVSDFFAMLKQMVQAEFAGEFTSITWTGDTHIPQLEALTQEVAYHAVREIVRNAAIHGRGDNPQRELNLALTIECNGQFRITIQDDGVGTDKGMGDHHGGLILHSTMLAVVGGTLTTESSKAKGTTVRIQVPIRGERTAQPGYFHADSR